MPSPLVEVAVAAESAAFAIGASISSNGRQKDINVMAKTDFFNTIIDALLKFIIL